MRTSVERRETDGRFGIPPNCATGEHDAAASAADEIAKSVRCIRPCGDEIDIVTTSGVVRRTRTSTKSTFVVGSGIHRAGYRSVEIAADYGTSHPAQHHTANDFAIGNALIGERSVL